MTPLELRKKLAEFLAERGLTAKDAAKLRLQLCSRREASARFSIDADGFTISYFGPDGQRNGLQRFRSLKVYGFAAVADPENKTHRYRSEKASKLGLYFPPFTFVCENRSWTWKEYVKDPSKPLVITEGEIKAAAATKLGIPTLGLSGVDCYRQNGKLLPAFSGIEWSGRPIYIAYDSDAATNPHVARAENALARELLNLGAKVHIVRIPTLHPGKKTAIDDFLVEKGADALMKLLEGAEEWEPCKELFALNEEVIYVKDPGLIVDIATMQTMSCRNFIDHAYAPRIYHKTTVNSKGGVKHEEKSAAREWIKWPRRATVKRLTYAPGQPQITDAGEFNLWPGWGTEPKRGDITFWKQLLDHLYGVEKDVRRWFEQWLAYPLQHPGKKVYTATVLWGNVHGTGKSLVGYTMQRIYGNNWSEIGEKELHGNHNEWAQNKQFIMADEIEPAGDTKRRSADRMKSMITQTQLRINPKYVPAYTVPDCINYYLTSNHPDSLHLENRDRRFMIWEVEAEPKEDSFYQNYVRWLDEQGGASALFDYFLRLDCSDFNPAGHAPQTRAKQEMIELSRSDVATWVAKLKENPDSVLRTWQVVLNRALWTIEELHSLYPSRDRVTVKGLFKELKVAGFKQVNNRKQVEGSYNGKRFQKRLWAIRDAEIWLNKTPAKLIAQYAEERSGEIGDGIAAKYILP